MQLSFRDISMEMKTDEEWDKEKEYKNKIECKNVDTIICDT